METITTKEQALELIQSIVKNERFKVDAYFFCGFPTDQPNEKLIQLCEAYLDQQDAGTKTAMLTEMERMVSAGAALGAESERPAVNQEHTEGPAVRRALLRLRGIAGSNASVHFTAMRGGKHHGITGPFTAGGFPALRHPIGDLPVALLPLRHGGRHLRLPGRL